MDRTLLREHSRNGRRHGSGTHLVHGYLCSQVTVLLSIRANCDRCGQIGQCGNQLGQYIFNTVHENGPQDPYSPLAIHSGSHPFFRPSEDNQAIARAVLVDTEPKVLDICRQRRSPWRYEERNVVRAGQGGAGNNWAHGYGPVSRKSSQVVMESIRREAEKADSLEAFMVVHSVAGGTGSGLGTAVTERLQDE